MTLEQENRQMKARVAELERLVAWDTLTPLFNRRHFMEELDRWCWRAHRYGVNHGLLIIAVDNLHEIKNCHGWSTGDAMLIAIAKALETLVRRSDLVARIDGDKFAILLDNIPEAKLEAKAQRVVNLLGKVGLQHQGEAISPNISVGFIPLEAGVKPSELLARADRSMMAARQAKGLGPLV